MKIVTEIDIKDEDIADLLSSALEGGSNYWYMITGKIDPTKWTFSTMFLLGEMVKLTK